MLISSVVSLILFHQDVAVPKRLQKVVGLESKPGNTMQQDYLLDLHIAVETSAQIVLESKRYHEKCFPLVSPLTL